MTAAKRPSPAEVMRRRTAAAATPAPAAAAPSAESGERKVVNVDLPRELWLEARRRCDTEGVTLRAWVRSLIERELNG